MKKSDLKVGMSVEDRVGNKCQIVDVLLGYYDTLLDTMHRLFNNDLTNKSFKVLDIIKVYDENGKLIWERENERSN